MSDDQGPYEERLEALRKRIDLCDSEIVRTLVRRGALVREVAALKTSEGVELRDGVREYAVISKVLRRFDYCVERDLEGGETYSRYVVEAFYRALLDSYEETNRRD